MRDVEDLRGADDLGDADDVRDADEGTPGGARDADRPGSTPGTGWRVAGVPPGAAAGLLVLAVVVLLLLGRGGPDEVLVGSTAAAPAAPTAGGTGAPAAVATLEPAPGTPPGAAAGAGTGEAPAAVGQAGAGVVPGAPPAEPAGPVLVHVDGAVHRPGVVVLRPGDRVADAVEAAGGVTDGADTRLVNLARTVVDGELVVLPAQGEAPLANPAAGAGPAPGPAARGGPGTGDPAGPTGLVDLNTADAATLQTLPGIGPVLAERVVAWREESGPFASVADLGAVRGIGPAVLADVADLVTV